MGRFLVITDSRQDVSVVLVVVIGVYSHIQRVLSLQPKKLRSHNNSAIIDLSNTNPDRGHKEVRSKVIGSHHGENPLLRPTGIQIAAKSLLGPTNREHRNG